MDTATRGQHISAGIRKKHKMLLDGAKLTECRIRAAMTGLEVGKYLGCNKSAISRYEREENTPRDEQILKLVALFGTLEFVKMQTVDAENFISLSEQLKTYMEGK